MIGAREIIIIYAIAVTILLQVVLIKKGHTMLREHTEEKVEMKICSYSGVISWILYVLLIILWPALDRGPWHDALPFGYFYKLFKNPCEILPGINTAHVIIFASFGLAFSFVNIIITSYLAKTFKSAKMRRIQ